MATSLDVRTYVLMDRLSNDGISLELVDLQFHHSWSMAELERFLGKLYTTILIAFFQAEC